MPRPLRIFTVAYGQQHLMWMRTALVRSLSWPQNKAALQHAKWTIFGDLENTQEVFEMATQVLPFHQIELRTKIMDKGQVDLLACMMWMMRMCALDKAQMLMAPPDTIFADGTINTLLEYGEQQDTCVAVPHPRVLPSIIHDLTFEPISNAKLVTLALDKHVHSTWSTANQDLAVNGTHVGGVSWQKVGDHVWALQHRLPTVYLANFTEGDRKFFSKPWKGIPPQFGMWDHEWPGVELLGPEPPEVSNQRMRMIGCSDAAFIMELTEPWKNIPTQRMINPDERDAFHRDEYHNKINRQYVSCFRGEG